MIGCLDLVIFSASVVFSYSISFSFLVFYSGFIFEGTRDSVQISLIEMSLRWIAMEDIS